MAKRWLVLLPFFSASVGLAALPCTLTPKWNWDGAVEDPAWPDACGTPLVVRLRDTNRSGGIDRGDTPSVVFMHTNLEQRPNEGVITAVDGASGLPQFTTSGGARLISGLIAAADLDRDGYPEIIGWGIDRRITAFAADGSLRWVGDRYDPAPHCGYTIEESIVVADLDQDSVPEILSGAQVFDSTGRFLWAGAKGQGLPGGQCTGRLSHALELDPASPGLEVLAGNTLYSASGSVLWTHHFPGDPKHLQDGYTAVADLDGDGAPEIVLGGVETVVVLSARGAILVTHAMPKFYQDSFVQQPVAADFDGDGLPEVAVAQDRYVEVLKWDGARLIGLWSLPLDGPHAHLTAFDYDGDGLTELVLRDATRLLLLDGPTGTVLATVPAALIRPRYIMSPVVANVDEDCAAELVMTGCAYLSTPIPVVAYGCDGAAPARALWHEVSYHVTNVNDDATVPAVALPSWQAQNTFQAQAGPAKALASPVSPAVNACIGETVSLDAAASGGCYGGPLEFRWLEGATERCTWSSSPICDVVATTTTVYTLEARCAGDPCAQNGSYAVLLTVIPDLRPGDLGNTLRAIRVGLDVSMSWASDANARTYGLYRQARDKTRWPATASLSGLNATTAIVPDVPVLPDPLYFYRVTAASCSGIEGP